MSTSHARLVVKTAIPKVRIREDISLPSTLVWWLKKQQQSFSFSTLYYFDTDLKFVFKKFRLSFVRVDAGLTIH